MHDVQTPIPGHPDTGTRKRLPISGIARLLGIPREKIRVDRGKKQVQVMGSTTAEVEIEEIMKRHSPTEIHTS